MQPTSGRGGRTHVRALGLLALALGLAAGTPAGAREPATPGDPAALRELGRRIYQEGILPSGRPLRGVAQAGVERAGPEAACQGCHRPSGYGASEGTLEVRPITGPALFGERPALPVEPAGPADPPATGAADTTAAARVGRIAALAGRRQRPPYDEATLARAIRDGVDVIGRPLDPGMPRYPLEDGDLRALAAYLRTLSAQTPPGVTADRVHLATVIQPGVDAASRRAMVEVLARFLEDRNAGQREEARRVRAGYQHLGRTYREWVLHVWELRGPSSGWLRQLEAFQARQPAFALVGGLGTEGWGPIHEFSERHRVPCVLPQTPAPVVEGPGFYTVYLSRGVFLEAEALAAFLRQGGDDGPVIQVHRRLGAGAAAARAFRRAWGGRPVAGRVLEGAADRAFWRRLAGEIGRATVVLWLASEDLAGARALVEPGARVGRVYLSSTLGDGDGDSTGLAAAGGDRVRVLYPRDLPQARAARLRPVQAWLREKGIAPAAGERGERVQLDAYLAATATGAALVHAMDAWSGELLLESLEHGLGRAFEPTLYPRLALGPGQRFASKGSYVVEADGPGGDALRAVSGWIVP
jgi:hypothetical protein